MPRFASAFLAGMLLPLSFQALPNLLWILPLLVVAAILFWRRAPLALLFLAGLLYAWLDAASYLHELLPESLERSDLVVEGCVTGLPSGDTMAQRFLFDVNSTHQVNGESVDFNGRVRLSWYGSERNPRPGDCGELVVRLLQPRGFSNPGGMDYERWLFQQDLVAKGYVREEAGDGLIESGSSGIDNQRLTLRERIMALSDSDAVPVYLALLIGDRSLLESSDWELFRQTGTSHLVAISGLHIGLVAMLAWWLCGRAWRYAGRLPLYLPSPMIAAICALAAASLYAALAGFAIPTQRALLMTLFLVAGVLIRRQSDGFNVLAIALFAVLVIDPRSLHSAGFWLSFLAVLSILLVHRKYADWSKWRLAVSIQFFLSLLLIPVVSAWNLPVSTVSPLVNLVAVPWFSFVIVPLVLLSAMCIIMDLPGTGLLLDAVLGLLEITLEALQYAASLSDMVHFSGLPLIALLLAGAGFLILLLAKGWKRLSALPLMAFLFWPLPQEALRVTFLDVGQGLSVIVESGSNVLVYDLGPEYRSGFNTAEAVVMPFLVSRGIDTVDTLVISHDDIDHSGGYEQFLEHVATGRLVAGQPETLGAGFTSCHEQLPWRWGKNEFRFLDTGNKGLEDNDYSCVLLIENPSARILITGDITRVSETALVRKYPGLGKVDVATMPHHGSRTSSSQTFVEFLKADYVIATAGWKHHFGHPKPDIVERWERTGSRVLETAMDGAMTLVVNPGEGYYLAGHRQSSRRFWHR